VPHQLEHPLNIEWGLWLAQALQQAGCGVQQGRASCV
jgi:hypothetical protein